MARVSTYSQAVAILDDAADRAIRAADTATVQRVFDRMKAFEPSRVAHHNEISSPWTPAICERSDAELMEAAQAEVQRYAEAAKARAADPYRLFSKAFYDGASA